MKITYTRIKRQVQQAGYVWFETPSRAWNVNIVALRTPSRVPNLFNDWLTLSCHDASGSPVFKCWPVTTDPGTYWLNNPGRVNGTAILAPGQYRSSHTIRQHAGAYDAVCQKYGTTVPVYRDADQDGVLDVGGKIYNDGQGINIHRSSRFAASTRVDKWSAGCIVHATAWGFYEMMALATRACDAWGNTFTVTLLDWPDAGEIT